MMRNRIRKCIGEEEVLMEREEELLSAIQTQQTDSILEDGVGSEQRAAKADKRLIQAWRAPLIKHAHTQTRTQNLDRRCISTAPSVQPIPTQTHTHAHAHTHTDVSNHSSVSSDH